MINIIGSKIIPYTPSVAVNDYIANFVTITCEFTYPLFLVHLIACSRRASVVPVIGHGPAINIYNKIYYKY